MWSTQTQLCTQKYCVRFISLNDLTNTSASSGVVWQTALGYSFYSAFDEWEAYAVTQWPGVVMGT